MNRIIHEKVKTLKAMGRQALSGHWGGAILMALLAELFLVLPSVIYDLLPTMLQTSIVATIFNIYSIFIQGPISLSMANFFIKLFRQEKFDNPKAAIKFGFGYTKKAVGLYIRITLLTWLGSMFFIIPGILMALNYSQAFYILADDPSKAPAQCMYESKFIMRGNRIKYICLILSFIGWYLLAAIPAGICHIVIDSSNIQMLREYIMSGDIYNAMIQATIQSPLVSILLLLQVIVKPYVISSQVSFFDILVGRLVVRQSDDDVFTNTQNNVENNQDFTILEDTTETVSNFEYKEIDLNNEEDNNDELH